MLPHTLITASAGSGKTWRLTVRYLRLVMMGAEPESIVALTFSRKAAGEFFNAILHRLAEAAAGTVKAEALARDIEMPGTTADDFCQALVRLTSRLPFLMLGTLDSFFIRMARSFPFELGLSGEFALLDGHQVSVERLRVYDRVFAPDDSGPGTAAREEFRRAFTEATFGKDEMRVKSLLDDFIGGWHYEYLATPDGRRWGNPTLIWPEDPPVPGETIDRSAVIQRIETGLARLVMSDAARKRWTDFLTAAAAHIPGAPMSKPMVYLWDKLLAALPALKSGSAELMVERKRGMVEGPLAEALTELCQDILSGELAVALRQTRGIFEVVRKYDEVWHTMVRRQGKLTFHDVQLILSGGLSPEAAGHDAAEARLLTHETNRQLMDYRLDARYHHWLLDEFQDTSRVQWRVLANLMDEAIQDSAGVKSFFAVGDVKQSIYEWRGGTPALFEELRAQYNHPGLPPEDQPLRIEPMSLSQRSGPAVIEMVNALLGDHSALAEVLPAAAVAKWFWQEHTSKNHHYGGTALAIEVDPKGGSDPESASGPGEDGTNSRTAPEDGGSDEEGESQADAAWHRAAELILELKPLRRGLTCAVLCHRNDRALRLTNFLRSATRMPVVCESDLFIAQDNPVTSALLALLQAAAHPGDTYAWKQVTMTPLAAIIRGLSPAAATAPQESVRQRAMMNHVLTQIAELGFHDTLRWWSAALVREQRKLHGEMDPFSQGRMDSLLGCAREFDSSGSRDVDEFLAFARSWTERGASHDGALQVMTVHRSKGLTFDVVIMPDLGYQHTFINRIPVGRGTDDHGGVNWLTRLPNKDIAEADPVLKQALDRATGDLWCERIAGLYVMVTRAKYANYLFLPPAPKKSGGPSLHATARHMLSLAQPGGAGEITIGGQTLPLVAKFGDPDWISDHPLQAAVPQSLPAAGPRATEQPDLFAELSSADSRSGEGRLSEIAKRTIPLRARPRKTRPSSAGDDSDASGQNTPLFPEARLEAQTMGLLVHRLLSLVEWADVAGLEAFEQRAARLFPQPDDITRAALAEVRASLRAPALAGCFLRPDQGPEGAAPEESAKGSWQVWRERAFDVMVGGTWSSGVFDRVIIRRDSTGNAAGAFIFDFKTGTPLPSPEAAAAGYKPQLSAYRDALARLLALDSEAVKMAVLFTRTGEMIEF